MDKARMRAVPQIRRARGFRLYDGSGRRIIDLHQAGGGAILGHRGAGTVREIKDVLSRGLSAALPNVYEARLAKLIRRMFPAYGGVGLYACLHRGLEAASSFLGRAVREVDVRDPALPGGGSRDSSVSYWRPFLPPEGEPRVLIPILPAGGTAGFAAVCFRTGSGEAAPPGDVISACAAAAALRALADLEDSARVQSAVTRAIDGSKAWFRKGPYFSPVFPEGEYDGVFLRFLDAGYLLNPDYPGPSIVPGELSPGESAGLCALLRGARGG